MLITSMLFRIFHYCLLTDIKRYGKWTRVLIYIPIFRAFRSLYISQRMADLGLVLWTESMDKNVPQEFQALMLTRMTYVSFMHSFFILIFILRGKFFQVVL